MHLQKHEILPEVVILVGFIIKIKFKKNLIRYSRARVNLPHIGNSQCIKFVLQRFCLTILKVYPFLVEICMGGTLRSLQFCPWFQKLLPKLPSDLFSGEICITKNLRFFPFLDGICMGCQISKF
jgi:hypothetical protein